MELLQVDWTLEECHLSQEKFSVLSLVIFMQGTRNQKKLRTNLWMNCKFKQEKPSVSATNGGPRSMGHWKNSLLISCRTHILQPWPTICWKWHHLTWHSQSSGQNVYLYLGQSLERPRKAARTTVSTSALQNEVSTADQLVKSWSSSTERKKRRLKPRQKL